MHIQPIFKSLEIKQDSRHGFVIQLINFIEIKFKADLNLLSLPENHQVLSHVIKETISFDSKILENFWYNSKLADVFLDDSDIIKAWVSIEFDNTFDTFTAIIKESYSTLSLQKTPKKALEFKLLIQDVSLRYLGIQNNKLKMIFFDQIQLVLINEFLILVKSDVEKSPYNSIELYSSILSNLEFILDCLIEWNNDAIFLGLIESALVGPFDTSITEYTRSIEKLLDITVSEIIETISKLAIKYKRQVWNITSVDSLSHELMTSWQYLKDSEILLSKYLNGTRLMQINYSLAMQLDLLFFDICKYNLFSIQGANQLKTDSNQMAILLNAPNLKKINETCLLLSMDLDSENGSVLELLVGLKNADDKRLFLDQIGIVCLSPAEVVEIIDKRIDMK